jgi:hypothetical protein
MVDLSPLVEASARLGSGLSAVHQVASMNIQTLLYSSSYLQEFAVANFRIQKLEIEILLHNITYRT